MNPVQVLGIAVAVAGVVFLIMGVNATDSPFEHLSETLTGSYTDRTQWYIAGGLAALVGGGAMALLRMR